MRRSLVLFLVILFVQFGFGQQEQLKPFNTINAFGPFQIELIPSDHEALEMESHNIASEDLEVEVRRGELKLKIKSRHYLTDWDSDKWKKPQYVKTRIYFKQLDELQASAGAIVKCNETLRTRKFLVTGSMGAEINLQLVAETVYAKSNMGATVNLKGRTTFLEVKAGMGGVLKASQLESKSAYVSASMGSEVSIYASEEIDIAANFGADVKYSGDPIVRHTNRKMGADISKR